VLIPPENEELFATACFNGQQKGLVKQAILEAAQIGYMQAVTEFAIWRDGERYIGVMEQNIKDIFKEISEC